VILFCVGDERFSPRSDLKRHGGNSSMTASAGCTCIHPPIAAQLSGNHVLSDIRVDPRQTRERVRAAIVTTAMSAEVALLRHKARRCRELAWGRDHDVVAGLRRLADEFDAEANALEACDLEPVQRAVGGNDEPS
jgi:hypothetical protein